MEELKEKNNNIILIIKGLGIAMVLTLIMILILSIILSLTNVKESVIMPTVVFISSFSILISAFFVAKRVEQKGIICGSVLGISYMFILYIISSIMNFNFSLNLNAVIMIVFGLIGGAIGGILGANLK